ncbi:MAG: hypothetical protein IJ877_00215 [Candidatus Gastranaerophilales bacterium]|nr:hypothetical protein [Candidatus Gastranaerophilales bacterium]
MKIILQLFIIIFLLSNLADAKNLKGKVTYTQEAARIEAFKDLARTVPKKIFKDYKKDKNTKENIKSLKEGNLKIEDEPKRNINPFYMWDKIVLYSVEYEDDINKKYYYNPLGHLVKYEINDYAGNYPYRAIAYDKDGEVINITFVVSETESFIFDKDEKLIGHWVDNEFYDENEKKSYQRVLE